MARLIVILGDQLSPALPSLQNLLSDDVILLAEVASEASYVKHHKHKIIFFLSAMRTYRQQLLENKFGAQNFWFLNTDYISWLKWVFALGLKIKQLYYLQKC